MGRLPKISRTYNSKKGNDRSKRMNKIEKKTRSKEKGKRTKDGMTDRQKSWRGREISIKFKPAESL